MRSKCTGGSSRTLLYNKGLPKSYDHMTIVVIVCTQTTKTLWYGLLGKPLLRVQAMVNSSSNASGFHDPKAEEGSS